MSYWETENEFYLNLNIPLAENKVIMAGCSCICNSIPV